MDIFFEKQAHQVAMRLYESNDPIYDRLQEVLERISEDPEESKYARWTEYISSRNVYGTKVPGGDYTVFWKPMERGVVVILLVEDWAFEERVQKRRD